MLRPVVACLALLLTLPAAQAGAVGLDRDLDPPRSLLPTVDAWVRVTEESECVAGLGLSSGGCGLADEGEPVGWDEHALVIGARVGTVSVCLSGTQVHTGDECAHE